MYSDPPKPPSDSTLDDEYAPPPTSGRFRMGILAVIIVVLAAGLIWLCAALIKSDIRITLVGKGVGALHEDAPVVIATIPVGRVESVEDRPEGGEAVLQISPQYAKYLPLSSRFEVEGSKDRARVVVTPAADHDGAPPISGGATVKTSAAPVSPLTEVARIHHETPPEVIAALCVCGLVAGLLLLIEAVRRSRSTNRDFWGVARIVALLLLLAVTGFGLYHGLIYERPGEFLL